MLLIWYTTVSLHFWYTCEAYKKNLGKTESQESTLQIIVDEKQGIILENRAYSESDSMFCVYTRKNDQTDHDQIVVELLVMSCY